MGKAFDEGVVKIEKAYCPSYFGDIFGCWPCVYARDFYRVHACHPLFKDYPQVIHGRRMERAFLQLKVEVMVERNLKYVTNGCYVSFDISTCCNADVVHVYSYSSPLKFVFEDGVLEDIVHHGLKSCRRVGESEVHDCGFEETIPRFECCFPLVSFLDSYVVVSPSNIQLCVDVGITEVSYEVRDKR